MSLQPAAWSNSKIEHPRLHRSYAVSYCFSQMTTSGARYHLDPMWFDKLRFFFWRIFYDSFNLLEMAYLNFLLRELFDYSAFSILSRTRFEFPLPLPMWQLGSDLERPKSHIFTLQSIFIRIFEGLRSLCMMFAECRN